MPLAKIASLRIQSFVYIALLAVCALDQQTSGLLGFELIGSDTDKDTYADTAEAVSSNSNNTFRPVIHTYYERLSPAERLTSMTDHDDAILLDFWKESWSAAGWEPIVLSEKDAARHPAYQQYEVELKKLGLDAFGKMIFTRWLAMAAAGGGWLSDYDAFPLKTRCNTDDADMMLPETLPNGGAMTIHEVAAPSLASGTAAAWFRLGLVLLEDATKTLNSEGSSNNNDQLVFWSDTLGIINLFHNSTLRKTLPLYTSRRVVSGDKALAEGKGAGINLPTSICSSKLMKNKWVVHFGPTALQRTLSLPSGEMKLPKHRVTVAKDWLSKWSRSCCNQAKE